MTAQNAIANASLNGLALRRCGAARQRVIWVMFDVYGKETSAVSDKASPIIVFCDPSDRVRAVIGAETANISAFYCNLSPVEYARLMTPPPGDGAILLGIGRVGCEAVARRVSARLERIASVVLVDAVAPWAERPICERCHRLAVSPRCGKCDGWGNKGRLPLGPLEPLRAVAEMAAKDPSKMPVHSIGTCARCSYHGPGPGHDCRMPVRLVIACHPEPVSCAFCEGRGRLRDHPASSRECSRCNGTGKALGSAEVARELTSMDISFGCIPEATGEIIAVDGGLTLIRYPTRAELEARAIADALKVALAP